MKDTLERNRKFLDSSFPGLSNRILPDDSLNGFSYTHSPTPNILTRDRPLHARSDPIREALNLVGDTPVRNGTVILCVGLGLGFHVEKLKDLYAENLGGISIIIVERSVEAFSLLCRNRDISFLRDTELFIGDSMDLVRKHIDTLTALSFQGYRIIRLRGSFSLFEQYYTEVEEYFKNSLTGKLSDLLTRFAFESLWIKNIIDNIPSITGSKSVRALQGILAGNPVLIINAGPSLEKQLDLIHSIKDRIHLIAVDTALTPLLLSGIYPDFLITLDAGFFNTLDFRTAFIDGPRGPAAHTSLVADLVAHPQILRNWQGKIYFSETDHTDRMKGEQSNFPLLDLFHEQYPHTKSLECGGSISTTAIEFALFTGADPVYVSALDLAYTGLKTHVNSSPHFEEMYRTSNRLNPLGTSIAAAIQGRRLTLLPAISGGSVVSDFIFSQYLSWISERLPYRGRVINCTRQGAFVRGLHHLELGELARDAVLPRRKPRPNPGFHAGAVPPFSSENAVGFLEALHNAVSRMREDLRCSVDTGTLMQRHGIMRGVILEARKLYGSEKRVRQYLQLFLQFIAHHIERAQARIRP
jgi:hypothetical protein